MPQKKPAIEYRRTFPDLPQTPNAGYLYACKRGRNEMHVPNNTVAAVDAGVSVDIPAGLAIEVLPMTEWEMQSLRCAPQLIEGPVEDFPLHVVLYNHAGGTQRLSDGEAIARVRAVAVPEPQLWRQKSDTPGRPDKPVRARARANLAGDPNPAPDNPANVPADAPTATGTDG